MLPWCDSLIFYLLAIFTFQDWDRVLASKAPPTWVKQPPTGVIFFLPAGKVTLDCVAEVLADNPALTYSWLKNGQRLKWVAKRMSMPQNSGTLTINPILREDEGFYQCQANNTWGVVSSNIVNIQETFLDAFPASEMTNIRVLQDDPLALYCAAPRSSPQATLHWQKQLENSPALHEIKDDDGRITLDSNGTLWFSYVTMDDASNDFTYVCTAHIPRHQTLVFGHRVAVNVINKWKGTHDRRPTLQFASPGVQTAIRGSQVKLYCIYDGKPSPKIVWRKGNQLLMPENDDRFSLRSKGKILLINNVTTADDGIYICIANNSAGKAPPHNIFLDVQVLPYFTVEPTSVTARQGEKVEIRCEAAGDPQPTITWTKNGKPVAALPGQKVVTLHSAKVADTANFGCNASSEIGHVYKDIAINVLECDVGFYGMRCRKKCSGKCKDDETCNFENGHCSNGCEDGYSGEKCDSQALSSTVIIIIFIVTLIFALLIVIGLTYTCTQYERLQQIKREKSINLHENRLHTTQRRRHPCGHEDVTPRIDSVIYDEIQEDVEYETILETRQDDAPQIFGPTLHFKKSVPIGREIKVGNLEHCVEVDGYLVATSAGSSRIQMQPVIPIKPGDVGSPYADVLNLDDSKTVAAYDYIRFNSVKI